MPEMSQVVFEYNPHGLHGGAINPKNCRAAVSNGPRSMSFHQCYRKAVSGKWCKQHSPEAVAKRKQDQADRWEAERERDSAARLNRAIADVCEELEKMGEGWLVKRLLEVLDR